MFGRQKMGRLVAEFLGTGILTFLILSVQRSTIGVPFFVATAAGLALMISTYIFHESSGAHFNPAITIGLWTARKITTAAAVVYVVVQLLGGLLAGRLYTYYSGTHLQAIGGHYTTKILIAEAVGTLIFSLGIAATVYRRFSAQGAAVYAGIAYLVGILTASAGNAALGLLNPAVALGVHAWVWGTYVLGPVAGAIIGVNLYTLLFADRAALDASPLGASWTSSLKLSRSSTSDRSDSKPSSKTKSSRKKR